MNPAGQREMVECCLKEVFRASPTILPGGPRLQKNSARAGSHLTDDGAETILNDSTGGSHVGRDQHTSPPLSWRRGQYFRGHAVFLEPFCRGTIDTEKNPGFT